MRPPEAEIRARRLVWLICLVLAFATLGVFWSVRDHAFLSYDTQFYVTGNPTVRAGITLDGGRWAFTAFHAANWHPLTWLSHMLDCELFGLDPAGHHGMNAVLHLANSVLLFLVFRRMTGSLWSSAFVAALFAVHPLHVESVAWVAERKGVLSTLFWILAIGAYQRYAERPGLARYLAVAALFGAGLLAKPMVVTLPCALLLLDYWPLGRRALGWPRLVAEKLPLLALSALSSFTTLAAQQAGGALGSLALEVRVANGVVAYVRYLGKFLWPRDLAVFYPHPGAPELWQAALAALLLAVLSLGALWRGRERPYLPVGWLWFLGTLVPVLGLVQVGSQGMADRYTYLPLIGLAVVVAWGVPDLLRGANWRTPLLAAGAAVLLGAWALQARVQVGYWADDWTLFRHALRVTEDNYIAHHRMGVLLYGQRHFGEAIDHFAEALRIKPYFPDARSDLGTALLSVGRPEEALVHLSRAAEQLPRDPITRFNLAVCLEQRGRKERARLAYWEVLRLDPEHAGAHLRLGRLLIEKGSREEGEAHLREARRLAPKPSSGLTPR